MTPDMHAACDAYRRVHTLDLAHVLQRIQTYGHVEDIDRAVDLVNETRAALNALSDALSHLRAELREAL